MKRSHILTDDYLNRLVDKSIILPEDNSLFFQIIRESPSALRYLQINRNHLPEVNIDGTGGIKPVLIVEFINDMGDFPNLLLIPGLLDELFEREYISKSNWEKLKIRQIVKILRSVR